MNARTIQMIQLLMDGDNSVTSRQREFILAACRNPVPELARPEPPAPEERYLLVREAAAMLKVTPRTVQRWVRDGRLESRRVVGCRRIPLSAIRALCGAAPDRPLPFPTPGAASSPTDKGMAAA